MGQAARTIALWKWSKETVMIRKMKTQTITGPHDNSHPDQAAYTSSNMKKVKAPEESAAEEAGESPAVEKQEAKKKTT